ncbi:hypothetical protein SGLAD_v1c02410 [Spiroplasma gladiatoris]|uniref:Uncharacterized protein n=1 Tax=Spiroplasma gladiatoris TaxID=2143 RepID=A0A4P7AIU7_9MOLU|nr:hypothetical protein [Spiroplasma gladiatoris]QBQ07440.1 hypothetical protein SGLAD_v1c02410 [Spiroplasma gladiatoris]
MRTKKIYYKDVEWYSYLILAIFFSSMLIWGVYECCFKEYWYNQYPKYRNFESLMSFMSVQVNIMTIVWLYFLIICFNKKQIGVTSEGFKTCIINWNLIVFIVFWIGIIYSLVTESDFLKSYTTNQIACTVATHFICPLYLIILFVFTTGYSKLSYINWIKERYIYISLAYPFLYMIYSYIRGLLFLQDGISEWPYEFLEFEKDNLLVGNSVFGYMMLVIVVFATWIISQHLIMICTNNLIFFIREKYFKDANWKNIFNKITYKNKNQKINTKNIKKESKDKEEIKK